MAFQFSAARPPFRLATPGWGVNGVAFYIFSALFCILAIWEGQFAVAVNVFVGLVGVIGVGV